MDFLSSEMAASEFKVSEFDDDNKLFNKAFSSLGIHKLFTKNGWHLDLNDEFQFRYVKRGFELNIFEVTIQKDRIYVSVPIFNSPFQYKTYFTDYTSAYNYIEQKFYDFNE